MEVVVNGIPKPKLMWTKDDLPLDETYSPISKDKTHSISISETNASHSGVYKAIAENPAGIAESTAKVEVQTKPVITKPDDVKIISGEAFVVPITIHGNPEPKLKWMKDKVELSASLGIAIEKENNVYTLKLDESNTKLNGNYSVTGTNPAGSDSVQFKVLVIGNFHSM